MSCLAVWQNTRIEEGITKKKLFWLKLEQKKEYVCTKLNWNVIDNTPLCPTGCYFTMSK